MRISHFLGILIGGTLFALFILSWLGHTDLCPEVAQQYEVIKATDVTRCHGHLTLNCEEKVFGTLQEGTIVETYAFYAPSGENTCPVANGYIRIAFPGGENSAGWVRESDLRTID